MLSRTRIAVALTVVVAVVAAVGIATGLLGGGREVVAPPGGPAPDCVAEADAEMRDVDTDDSPEYPWPRRPGETVIVQFETADLSPRYAGFVEEGARLWSQGGCVDAVAVARCDAGANCTTVIEEAESPDGETDGESAGDQEGDVRVGNRITLYTDLLDRNTENGALATVVHEMGHALGLLHRNDDDAMMNAVTGPDTDPAPDETDFYNLTVLYGTPQG